MPFTDPLHAGYLHDTEREVLGVLVRFPHRIADLLVHLRPESFHHDDHRALFGILRDRVAAGKLTDPTTLREASLPVAVRQLLIDLLDTDCGASPHRVDERIAGLNRLADLRGLRTAARQLLDDALEPGERTAEEIVVAGQEAFMALGTRHANGTGPVSIGSGLDGWFDEIDERQRNPGRILGLPTHLPQLDQVMCGLHRGDLTIVAGRPSMGKTSLALNFAEHLALNHHDEGTALVFSMEMNERKLMGRIACSVAQVSASRLRTGELHQDEYDRLHEWRPFIAKMPIRIDPTASIDLATLTARAKRERARNRLSIIVVDYIQIMGRPGQANNQNDSAAIGKITAGLKSLALALDVPVVALSQLNRDLEKRDNKRPRMSDLRESGSIEQDADNIVFVYRDEVYNPDTADKGVAELIIAKQRDGELDNVRVGFQGQYTRFDRRVPDPVFRVEERPKSTSLTGRFKP